MKIVQRLIALVLTLSLFSSIGPGAWAETLKLPASLKVIGEEAFAGDSSLDKVVIPEGVESIGPRAFADSSVKSVVLPASVTDIADDAFSGSSPAVTAIKDSYAWRWAAAHGLVTALAFQDSADYEYTVTRAAFHDNSEIGLSHNSWIRNYVLANYDTLEEKNGGAPSWNIEFVGDSYGARISCSIGSWAGDGARAIDVMIDNEPQFPCTVQYRVTCTWGEETISSLGTIDYREMMLPTAILAEDSYRMKINEPFTLRASILPENLTYQDEAYCSVTTKMKCEKQHEEADGDAVCILRPLEAGAFTATLYKRYGNIRISKSILLLVEDENGNVPQSTIGLHADYAFSMFTSHSESADYIVHLNDMTRGISPDNWDLMQALYGDDCEWTFEPMDGSELALSWVRENRAFRFQVDNYAQMPEGNVGVKATLRWGDTMAVTVLHFHFGVLPVPGKICFDRNISMRPGETYEATAGIEDPDWNYSWILYYTVSDSSGQMESWNHLSESRNSFYLRASGEGLYAVRPMLVVGDNANICGDWCIASVLDRDPADWHVREGSITESAAEQIAESRFEELTVNRLNVEGIPLYEVYRDDGQKKPLVILLHGGGTGNKENHIKKAARLALEGMYAVTIDSAGCGDSTLGPIDAITCWGMTISQIDKLIAYYSSTNSQVDVSNFGLYGKSMGSNICYGYVVHGKYDPTVVVTENGTPDYLTLKKEEPGGPLYGAFDHGAAGRPYVQMTEEEVDVIADRMAPIHHLEAFLNVAVYAGSWTEDPYVPMIGNKELESYLDTHGGTKHAFLYFEGAKHGETFPSEYDFLAAFKQYLLNE